VVLGMVVVFPSIVMVMVVEMCPRPQGTLARGREFHRKCDKLAGEVFYTDTLSAHAMTFKRLLDLNESRRLDNIRPC
jgi:hypothetical protein